MKGDSEMAEEKGQKKKKQGNIRLTHGKITEIKGFSFVPFEALIRDKSGKPRECKVTFYNENFVKLREAETDGGGKVKFILKTPTKFKTVKIRMQINGTSEEAEDSVEIGKDFSKGSLRLTYQKPKVVTGKINIVFEAIHTVDGKVVEGSSINFFGSDPRVALSTQTTDKNGKAFYNHLVSLGKTGEKVTIKAGVDGTSIVAEDTVELKIDPKPVEGYKTIPLTTLEYWQRVKVELKRPRHMLTLVPMFLIPILMLTVVLPKLGVIGSSIFFGIFFAAIVAITSRERKLIGRGIIYGAIAGGLNYLFPTFFMGTFETAAWTFLILGGAMYILEETTGSEINAFPWYLLYFCVLCALANILMAIVDGAWGYRHYQNLTYNLILNPPESRAAGEKIFHAILRVARWSNDYYPASSDVLARSSQVYLILAQLFDALQWLFVGLLITIVSIPGELRNWWSRLNMTGLRDFFASLVGLFGLGRVTRRT